MWPLLTRRVVGVLLSFSLQYFFFSSFVFASDTDIVINEIQIEPSGSSQWVEIYNKGSSDIDISNWTISDNTDHTYMIPSLLLPSLQCVSFTSGSFFFNTASSDGVKLKKDTTIIDSYTYAKSPGSGVSMGRDIDGTGSWITFSSPTKDRLNANGSSCLVASPTPSPSMTPTPTDVPTPTRTPTPTKTPTPSPTSPNSPTPSPTRSVSVTLTPKGTVSPARSATVSSHMPSNYPTAILGAKDTMSPSPTKGSVLVKNTKDSKLNPLVLVLCGTGALLMLICGILGLRNYRNR